MSDLELEKLTIEDFKLYSTNALKIFLTVRKKPITGSFETLVARAFTAYEEKAPVDHELEHRERTNLTEYQSKYQKHHVQDPMTIPSSDWLSESKGICTWPKTFFMDISRYFANVLGRENLWQRLECEYKEGKAYRYYADGFLGDLSIHHPESNKDVVIMKTKCVPSQRVNAKQYDVWVIIQKKNTTELWDGVILDGYCTCTAGLLGSCNHVAGMLFRLEIANLMGDTRKTCTSELCGFVVPSNKKKVVPGSLSSFIIKNENYSKLVTSATNEQARSKLKRKLDYLPMSESGKKLVSDKKRIRTTFYEALKDISPNSCFVQLMEGKEQISNVEDNSNDQPLTLLEHAAISRNLNLSEENYLDSIKLSKDQIDTVYQKTIAQSKSKTWIAHRKGRITASKFKKIYTRMNTLSQEDHTEDPEPLVKEIMGKEKSNPSEAMRFGLDAEPHAARRYMQVMRLKHRGIKFNNPGMTISESVPFISCTPDFEVNCPCCGAGLCEIKCPPSVPTDRAPSSTTWKKHLENRDKKNKLKLTSEYYFQIQGQMAITKRNYSDFFVFNIANRSYHLERIKFNMDFWQDMLSNLKLFWKTYVLPLLLQIDIKREGQGLITDLNKEEDTELIGKMINEDTFEIEKV